jgi:hypothetical protein
MVAIWEEAQCEGHFLQREGLQPSSATALSPTNKFGLNSISITATLTLKRVRRMVNTALVLVLTNLYGIDQSLNNNTASGRTCQASNEEGRLP